jgi:hypothetical protein
MPTPPGPTGPLPHGWHRLVWTHDGKRRYVVTTDVNSIVALYGTLCVLRDLELWANITAVQDIEHWTPGAAP